MILQVRLVSLLCLCSDEGYPSTRTGGCLSVLRRSRILHIFRYELLLLTVLRKLISLHLYLLKLQVEY